MRLLTRCWALLCSLLIACAGGAWALTPEQAVKIASGDSDDRIAALGSAVAEADPALLPFVSSVDGAGRRRALRAPLAWAAALCLVALAGPTCQRQPQPVFREASALVIALDLSRSMQATDVTPSRLARAVYKIRDLLAERDRGQTALMVFAGKPFPVTPLTDDTNTLVLGVTFHPMRALTERERGGGANRLATEGYRVRGNVFYLEPEDRAPATSQAFGAWYPVDSLENDLRIDRHIQKTLTYSGIPVFWAQDGGTQLTMGKVYDRTKEHLGTTDLGIINTRRKLLNAARALRREGATPPGVHNPEWYDVRAAAVEIPRDLSWFEATEHDRRVLAGVNQAGV